MMKAPKGCCKNTFGMNSEMGLFSKHIICKTIGFGVYNSISLIILHGCIISLSLSLSLYTHIHISMPATISKKNLDKINGININFVQNDPDR
jgi:hypothetical protein